jgi:hypothetical protein
MSTIAQGIYRNVEGKRFDVIGVAQLVEHAESGHELVIYRLIDDVRPLLACPLAAFTKRFTMVQSNQKGPR